MLMDTKIPRSELNLLLDYNFWNGYKVPPKKVKILLLLKFENYDWAKNMKIYL